MARTVLWDFDGTLAERPGMWSQTMIEILDHQVPGHGFTRDDLRPALQSGFPWHADNLAHPHLGDADTWWAEISRLLTRAYVSVGYAEVQAEGFAAAFRERYLDPSAWRLYDDTAAALERLADREWRHVVVSNHVPELAELADGLGLGALLDDVVTSATVGFEKPHPRIFEHALERAGHPDVVWMVGDTPAADIAGAEALGIPAILVRTEADVEMRCENLTEAAELILGDDV